MNLSVRRWAMRAVMSTRNHGTDFLSIRTVPLGGVPDAETALENIREGIQE